MFKNCQPHGIDDLKLIRLLNTDIYTPAIRADRKIDYTIPGKPYEGSRISSPKNAQPFSMQNVRYSEYPKN